MAIIPIPEIPDLDCGNFNCKKANSQLVAPINKVIRNINQTSETCEQIKMEAQSSVEAVTASKESVEASALAAATSAGLAALNAHCGNNLFSFEKKDVSTTDKGTEQYAFSTFTGWGSPVGVRNKFNNISLLLRSFDSANPVTKIRVRVKETNRSGVILAEKLIENLSLPISTLIDFQFENYIDTTTPLYIEFIADNMCASYAIADTENIYVAQSPTYYSTSKNTDDSPSSTSSQELVLYAVFKDINLSKLILSEEGFGYFKEKGLGGLNNLFQKVSHITTDEGSEIYSSSTFSGWGCAVGVVKQFNSIELKIRSWDNTNPVTKIRVRIRDRSRSGAVLAESLLEGLNLLSTQTYDLKFKLDKTVDTNTPLWIEYVTDGMVSLFGTTEDTFSSQTAEADGYTTNRDISAGINSLITGGTKLMYAKFNLTTNNVELTTEGKSLFSINNLFEPLIERKKQTLQGSEQYAFSTFTGWGCAVGPVEKFDSLKLSLHGWDDANPVTKVRVNVKENNYDGALLGTKLLSELDISTLTQLSFSFENSVETTTPLWIEFLADSVCSFEGYYSEEYGSQHISAYSTSGDTEASASGDVTSNSILFYAVFLENNLAKKQLSREGLAYFDSKYLDTVSAPRLNLPSVIYGTVGHALQIFKRGIIEDIDVYQYNMKTTSSLGAKGKNYPRYYQVDTSSALNQNVLIELKDKSGRVITKGNTVIKVREKPTNPTTTKKVLCFGDSLTSGGYWVNELKSLLNLSNVEFIGTVDNGTSKYEGYGGKTWSWYGTPTAEVNLTLNLPAPSDKNVADLTSSWKDENNNLYRLEEINGALLVFSRTGHSNTPSANGIFTHNSGATNTLNINFGAVSSSALNPFWDNSTNKLSFANYINDNGFGTIDYVYTLLTWNGLSGGRKNAIDHQTLISQAKVVLRQLHIDFPNAKVKMLGIQLPSLNGGEVSNYGDNSRYGNAYELTQTVFGMNLAYRALTAEDEFKNWCEFLDVCTQFDSENNMPENDYPVNSRSSKTEKRGTNGVHPNQDGYLQIADVAYRGWDF